MLTTQWDYPGSRWWKFDFHAHTPISACGRTEPWQRAIGTADEVTPEKWLLEFMAANIDCVAVTDHNSGAWIDTLKRTYAGMKSRAKDGKPPTGFRELTIFPGVEISVNGGVHMLAILDPQSSSSDIDSLLGAVDYAGVRGKSDGETGESLEKVIRAILDADAIPIPAHADQDKGLLQVNAGTRQCRLSAAMVRQALEVEGLLAVEWCDGNNSWPQEAERIRGRLATVLGSDCHNFQGTAVPGSRYTWVKMARPSLEGLRLALLDGNDISIRRVEDEAQDDFRPFRVPTHMIRSIQIQDARVIGNGGAATLSCSPFFNAVVGGRGTGKSTMVHALRLATRRDKELEEELGRDNPPQRQFDNFRKIVDSRGQGGALRPDTEIRVQWQRHEDGLDEELRLLWRADGKGHVVETLRDGSWQPAPSQDVSGRRFPLRILSQGQVVAMASDGRRALLSIIDESDANIGTLLQEFEEAKSNFFAQRARLRQLGTELERLPEVERLLHDVTKKLAALEKTDHAAVLRNFGQTQRQGRAVKALLEETKDFAKQIEQLSADILLDNWPEQYFSEADSDLLAWRGDMDRQMTRVREALAAQAQALLEYIESSEKDERLKQWFARANAAQQAHETLQEQLAAQGAEDPQAFARLTQQKQALETQRKSLLDRKSTRADLLEQIDGNMRVLREKRNLISKARTAFLQRVIENNPHVRMNIVPSGYDDRLLEDEVRKLIEAEDDRFTQGMGLLIGNLPNTGVDTGASATQMDRQELMQNIRQRLLDADASLGAHLQKYLKRRHEQQPEFADHIEAWFPEDDLRIEYRRNQAWMPIEQGSQGQRSAALLAFLLAFGDEPIVLDQPEDDLDNHLIYQLIVQQIRENKQRRQLIVVTHNPNVVVNGDAELVHAMEFGRGQCYVKESGALQDQSVREEVCRVMEGGHEAFARRWNRLGRTV